MDLIKILHELACSICQGTQKAKPKIELLHMFSAEANRELAEAGLKLLYPVLLDSGQPYHYTKAEDWAELFDYIYFKSDMPKYQASRFDCDDFAIWMKGLVGANFGLNYFGIVFGDTPLGYHGWNLFRTESGLVQLEPQTGKFFPLNEAGYFPRWILI